MGCYVAWENRNNPSENDEDLCKIYFYLGPISLIVILLSWILFLFLPVVVLSCIKVAESILRIEITDWSYESIFNSNL